jgi:hypothetical protein
VSKRMLAREQLSWLVDGQALPHRTLRTAGNFLKDACSCLRCYLQSMRRRYVRLQRVAMRFWHRAGPDAPAARGEGSSKQSQRGGAANSAQQAGAPSKKAAKAARSNYHRIFQETQLVPASQHLGAQQAAAMVDQIVSWLGVPCFTSVAPFVHCNVGRRPACCSLLAHTRARAPRCPPCDYTTS